MGKVRKEKKNNPSNASRAGSESFHRNVSTSDIINRIIIIKKVVIMLYYILQ